MADPLPYNKKIAKRVQEGAKQGLKMRAIFAQVQEGDFENTPKSSRTFYKKYQAAYDAALADQVGIVGGKIFNQAITGPEESPNTWKARELIVKSHGGWSPKETIEIGEAEDDPSEKESVVNTLLKALGKSKE